jgi:hypothetical protein
MSIVAQMPSHLVNTEEGRFQELFVNFAHQHQVERRLTLRLVIKRRPWDWQQLALFANR